MRYRKAETLPKGLGIMQLLERGKAREKRAGVPGKREVRWRVWGIWDIGSVTAVPQYVCTECSSVSALSALKLVISHHAPRFLVYICLSKNTIIVQWLKG